VRANVPKDRTIAQISNPTADKSGNRRSDLSIARAEKSDRLSAIAAKLSAASHIVTARILEEGSREVPTSGATNTRATARLAHRRSLADLVNGRGVVSRRRIRLDVPWGETLN
jgi:hypothetical protein